VPPPQPPPPPPRVPPPPPLGLSWQTSAVRTKHFLIVRLYFSPVTWPLHCTIPVHSFFALCGVLFFLRDSSPLLFFLCSCRDTTHTNVPLSAHFFLYHPPFFPTIFFLSRKLPMVVSVETKLNLAPHRALFQRSPPPSTTPDCHLAPPQRPFSLTPFFLLRLMIMFFFFLHAIPKMSGRFSLPLFAHQRWL